MSRSWESSRGRHGPRRRRTFHRRTLSKIVVLGVVVAALAAGGATALASGSVRDSITRNLAGAADGISSIGGSSAPAAPEVPPVLTVAPNSGAADVPPRTPVRTEVTSGELRDVALTGDEGKKRHRHARPRPAQLDGHRAARLRQSLRVERHLGPSGRHAAAAGGRVRHRRPGPHRGRDDRDPRRRPGRRRRPDRDPVRRASSRTRPRRRVERALKVTTSKKVEGAWAWLPDTADGSRVHYRPRTYWPTGTKVTVDAPLYGIDMGAGRLGRGGPAQLVHRRPQPDRQGGHPEPPDRGGPRRQGGRRATTPPTAGVRPQAGHPQRHARRDGASRRRC